MGSLSPKGYLGVPTFNADEKLHRRQLAAAVNNILQGKINNTTDITLREDAVSTSVSDARAGPSSVILVMPRSSTAATALNGWFISSRENGSFTITHVSTSTSDCTATYAIFG